MKYRRIFFIVLLAISIASFVDAEETQNEAHIIVASAHRTKELNTGLDKITAKMPDENVLLVIRIEGISLEEFREASEKKEIYIIAGENQFVPGVSQSAEKSESKGKVFSPFILLTFSVPKEILKMELVVSDYPQIAFEADMEISERLNIWEVK